MFEALEFQLELMLFESRVEDAKRQFPDQSETIDSLVAADPSGNNKYLIWAVKQVKKGVALEKAKHVIAAFHQFHQRLAQKDINQYQDADALAAELETVANKKTKRQMDKDIKKDATTIYEDDRFIVLHPETKAASCKYGAGSKWCIAAANNNMFGSYSGRNIIFYFVLDKSNTSNPLSKAAITVIRDRTGKVLETQVFNAEDHTVPLTSLGAYVGEKWTTIKHAIDTDQAKRGKTREAQIEDVRNPEELRQFAAQNDPVMDELLIRNQRTPLDVVEAIMAKDAPSAWAAYVETRIHNYSFENVRKALLKNYVDIDVVLGLRSKDADVLGILLQRENPIVKQTILQHNRYLPKAVFDQLAGSDDVETLKMLGDNYAQSYERTSSPEFEQALIEKNALTPISAKFIISRQSKEQIDALVLNPATPAILLAGIAASYSGYDRNITKDTLIALSRRTDPEIVNAITRNRNAVDIPEVLDNLNAVETPEKYRGLALHAKNPAMLARLVNRNDPEIDAELGRRFFDLPEDVQLALATRGNDATDEAIASRLYYGKTTPRVLAALIARNKPVFDEKLATRVANGAGSELLSDDNMMTLASRGNELVLRDLTSNKNVWDRKLENFETTLVTRGDDNVRTQIARHSQIPGVLRRVYDLGIDSFNRELVFNPATPTDIQNTLLATPVFDNEFIRRRDTTIPAIVAARLLANVQLPEGKADIALRAQAIPQNIALELASTTQAGGTATKMRAAGAKHIQDPNVLTQLAMDTEPKVRYEVAKNPRTPENMIRTLASDPNNDVKMGVAENIGAPVEVLQALARTQGYIPSKIRVVARDNLRNRGKLRKARVKK